MATILKQYGWGINRVKTHRDFSKKDCPHRTNMSEFKKLVLNELNKLTNKTQPQTYENVIIYSGDGDKAVAIIMKEFLPNSTIVDISNYKSNMCKNAYAIGASKGLEKFPDNVTKFVGKDFKETYGNVVVWLKNRKLM